MITLCRNHGIPEPEFSAYPDWFSVTFTKTLFTDERLHAMGLSDRQVKAVQYVRERGVITNKAYRELTGAIDRTALRDLNDLCTKGIFLKRDKKGRATEYVLVKTNPDNPDISPTFTPSETRHEPESNPDIITSASPIVARDS